MDELKRVRTLPWIRDDIQYEEYKESLSRYTTEYEFFKVKNPSWEVMEQKAKEFEEDTEAYVSLKNRARLIKNGEYGTALEKNIAAYVLAIAEYEAKQTGIKPIDIGKGLVNKDPQIMKYLQDRFLKSRAERIGGLGAEVVNLGLQSKVDVIAEIFEEYDFINIEKPEISLVPVIESSNKVLETVRGVFDNYIEATGITKDIETYRKTRLEEKKQDISANAVDRNDSKDSTIVQVPNQDRTKEIE